MKGMIGRIIVSYNPALAKKVSPIIVVDQDKLNEDLKYTGYNLIVTSELDMDPLQVYQTYHSLWKIEKSFRITQSYLDTLYLSEKEETALKKLISGQSQDNLFG